MKILFLSSLYPPTTKGGGEVSTHLIAQGLRARGHDVQVVADGERAQSTEVSGVPVHRLPLGLIRKPLLERRLSRRIAEQLSREVDPTKFDFVHAHDFRTALAVAEMRLPNSVVTARDYAQISGSTNFVRHDGSLPSTPFDDALHSHRIAEASWARKPFRLWQYAYNVGYRRRIFRALGGHVFISNAQRKIIAVHQEVNMARSAVIYNPVADDFLSERPVASVSGMALYVGTVEHYKGVGLLIEAWRDVAKHVRHAHLKIAGEGADRERYERQVEQLGLQYKVSFVGRVPWDRMRPVYDQASVVVAPHLWVEPFGRTAAEAMARGRVVVAADIGGPAELLRASDSGTLFAAGSVQDLSHKLRQVLMMTPDERSEIGEAARSWTKQYLEVDAIAAQYERFYEQLSEAQRQ